jgi:hypothetical protein
MKEWNWDDALTVRYREGREEGWEGIEIGILACKKWSFKGLLEAIKRA